MSRRRKKPGPPPRLEVGVVKPMLFTSTRERLAKELDETGGHIARTAWRMNVGRMTIYRWLKAWGMWPVVNEARRKRLEQKAAVPEDNLVELTRLAMRS